MIRVLKFIIIKYWGINQSVSYGTGNTILNTTAGIVDTGTTLLLLATGMGTHFIMVMFDTHRACRGLPGLPVGNWCRRRPVSSTRRINDVSNLCGSGPQVC